MKLSDFRVKVILFLILTIGVGVVIRQTAFIFSYNIHNNYIEKSLEQVTANEGFVSDNTSTVLIVYDEENLLYKENAEDLMQQIKMDYSVLEAKEYLNPSVAYPIVLIAVESFEAVGNSGALFKYVEQGGQLFFLKRVDLTAGFFNHYQKLGITEFTTFTGVQDIKLNREYLDEFRQREYSGLFFWNSSLIAQLLGDIPVDISSADQIPVLWQRKYGSGDITYFNGSMLMDRGHHVILLDYLKRKVEPFIYPVANIKLVTIGEFPAPLYEGEDEAIYEMFLRNNGDFYREVWWPDILSFGKRAELRYSTAALTSYQTEASPIHLSKEDYIYFAREILNQDGELGYQELSFIREGGLHESFLPRYKYNQFVPIDGIITEEEMSFIDENPSVVPVVSGIYRSGNANIYQSSFRERPSGVIEIPVISRGYVLDDMNRWLMNSGVMIQGIYHHYLSGNVLGTIDWENDYDTFTKNHNRISQEYPFLEAMTVASAADDVLKYNRQDFTLDEESSRWIITSSHIGDKYFYFHSDKEIVSITGGKLKRLPLGGYLLEMDSTVCILEWSKL